MMILYAETPLHPGTGQTTGVVDLPIQRERHTGFPKIEATGIKGALRSVAEEMLPPAKTIAIFGPETKNASDHAGALAPTDARVLAFPVRSLTDVFVWITCPQVAERLSRDAALGELGGLSVPAITPPSPGEARVVPDGPFTGTLILEELSFTVQEDAAVLALAKKIAELLPPGLDRIKTHLVILANSEFSYFVQRATSVTARISLTSAKTTGEFRDADGKLEKGNLWYEETLPPETVMYSLLMATDPRDQKKSTIADADGVLAEVEGLFVKRPYLQVGGNETVGQGWCAIRFSPNATAGGRGGAA
jgi:CRISPR-associated protein Cmr4